MSVITYLRGRIGTNSASGTQSEDRMELSKEETKRIKQNKLKNRKHEKLAKAIIENDGNKKKAYKEVYDCADSTATQRSSLVMKKFPEIAERTSELLAIQGIDRSYLSKKLKKFVNGDKMKSIVVDNQVVEVPDNHLQLKSIEMAYKLHGDLQGKPMIDMSKNEINLTQNNTDINVDADKLSEVLNKLSNLNKDLKFADVTEGEIIDVAEDEGEI